MTTVSDLKKFCYLQDGKLVPLNVKNYHEAIASEHRSIWARIPRGLIDWWLIKESGDVRYPDDWTIDYIRRSM